MEIQNTAVGPGGEVEQPVLDEVRRAIHSLENISTRCGHDRPTSRNT
jgi:hypothetical protein